MTGCLNYLLSPSFQMYNRTPSLAAPRIKHWFFYSMKYSSTSSTCIKKKKKMLAAMLSLKHPYNDYKKNLG